MPTDTDYLKSIAEEILAGPAANHHQPNQHLRVEARRLEKTIFNSLATIENFTQRDTYHFNTLSRLVVICDMLYGQTDSINPNVTVLMELLTAVRLILPSEISPNLKLPKAFLQSQKDELSAHWEEHQQMLAEYGIDSVLTRIAAIPFERFITGKQKLCWGDFTWLKGYLAKLEIMDWENADCSSKSEALVSLLIGRNFNDDRFYIYCKKYIQHRTGAITGKVNKLLEYAKCEKLILEDTQIGVPAFDPRANAVSDRLLKWIREEKDFVAAHERDKMLFKFEFKWNIETIAFFFKLLWDHKVFGKVQLEKFSEQIAGNCSSVGKDEFQPGSIYSRLYSKEPEVVRSVAALLSAMLADVTNYLQ